MAQEQPIANGSTFPGTRLCGNAEDVLQDSIPGVSLRIKILSEGEADMCWIVQIVQGKRGPFIVPGEDSR